MKAFPSEKKLYWLFRQGDKPVPNEVIEQGMDLRDYFAAKAMQSVMVNYNASVNGSYSLVSRIAYEIADAMMEARKK